MRIAHKSIIDLPCFFPPDCQDIVDKLLASPILPRQVDVLDLGTELAELTIASAASDASTGARPPMSPTVRCRSTAVPEHPSGRTWTSLSSLKALKSTSVRPERFCW